MKLSVVVPVYNEALNVEELHSRILSELKKMQASSEIIFVDDGSTDGTWTKLKNLKPLKMLRHQRNYGQTAALYSGFQAASGEFVATLDGDLQNDPQDLSRLLQKIEEGYDVVSGFRMHREDSDSRKTLSRAANALARALSGVRLRDSACAMKIYRREILKDVLLLGEMHVLLPAYLQGLGARVAEISVQHHARRAGVSKHYFLKAVKNIADLLTICFLNRTLSGRPLIVFGLPALVSFLLGIFSGFLFLVASASTQFSVWPAAFFICAVLFFLAAGVMFLMGFLAELLIRVYWRAQDRSPYLVRQTLDNAE